MLRLLAVREVPCSCKSGCGELLRASHIRSHTLNGYPNGYLHAPPTDTFSAQTGAYRQLRDAKVEFIEWLPSWLPGWVVPMVSFVNDTEAAQKRNRIDLPKFPRPVGSSP